MAAATTDHVLQVDILMRIHGADEVQHIATVDLPARLSRARPGMAMLDVDTSPIAEAGKAIAEALRTLVSS